MNYRSIILTISISFVLFGCQNPYSQFYTNVITADQTAQLNPYSGRSEFVSAPEADIKLAVNKLRSQGYACLGYASFEANAKDYGPQLRTKAKELSADIVLVSSSFARSISGVMPLLNYKPGATTTTFSSGQVQANASTNYGTSASGTAHYTGQSTTNTAGTFTTDYIPYNLDRSTYTASFWRKRSYIFGAGYEPLSVKQRQLLQRNTGLVIKEIVDGSPAFLSNVLTDDILVTIDGEPITTAENFNVQLKTKAGNKVKIGLLRNGNEMFIDVYLASAGNH